jgi:hypothetical protein
MGRFLVERYLPVTSGASVESDAQRLHVSGEPGVRLLLTLYCPDDETCFHLFDAGSAALVERVGVEAGIELGRIARVTQIPGSEPAG